MNPDSEEALRDTIRLLATVTDKLARLHRYIAAPPADPPHADLASIQGDAEELERVSENLRLMISTERQ